MCAVGRCWVVVVGGGVGGWDQEGEEKDTSGGGDVT